MNYTHRLENLEHQPYYHDIDICGSSLHGLATTIQQFIQKNRIDLALRQIRRCIKARNMHSINPDRAHQNIIDNLYILQGQLVDLEKYLNVLEKNTGLSYHKYILVNYNERRHSFIITFPTIRKGGKKCKTKRNKTRRNKTKRNKTKRNKTRRNKF